MGEGGTGIDMDPRVKREGDIGGWACRGPQPGNAHAALATRRTTY